ncbi:hypothetical protein [Haliangium sp. UPWRP_2]|uniref:hypothetical protein n=1 Tax=Haliangium sp. UPWRP_2 TaxID=1931276 RepID=UPI000B542044|nr:hypothetical protein [Haliangium sp. UPWRP_2]PSM31778.1 hypothetical protein BVG81_003630 [Haliangium sp. UPWRP_2]
MKQLAQLLVQHAPTGAVGYRVGEQFRFEGRRAELWFYPPSDRPFIRHDGELVHRPYFLLRPFEPPVVPVSGPYGVEYIGSDGTKFPMVLALAAGVLVEAGPRLGDGVRTLIEVLGSGPNMRGIAFPSSAGRSGAVRVGFL